MRTARQIYEKYKIMPSLQMHQLRVAAAAKLICGNFNPPAGGTIDTNVVLLSCLFHDMGNIIKSDLVTFPDFLEPEGKAHWEKVKNDFLAKYGRDEHSATAAIAREIGLPENVRRLIEGFGFSKLEITRSSDSYELKISEYGDLRVGPYGVLSMDARIGEASPRYVGKHPDMPRSEETFAKLVAAAYDVEKQIFEHCSIKPIDINDETAPLLIKELSEYPVS